MKNQVKISDFDRTNVKSGIIHIGVGNFHRAHQAFYTNLLLESDPSQSSWGICGVMLMPSDEKLYKTLKSQDCLYSLTVCGRDGVNEAFEVGSIVELLWSGENSQAVIDKIADENIKIITLTITEGGYNIDRATGDFMLCTPAIASDINNPENPQSVFGYVAKGLRERIKSGAGAITILSCDNLQGNGNITRNAFMTFFKAQDEELYRWAEQNITFPNSMVDRITPATKPEDVERLNNVNDYPDQAPIYAEDFLQWVIEDNFAAGRPAWESVGVEFCDNVKLYEDMKLSLLNASHTLLSYPSFLMGYRNVDLAMGDKLIVELVRQFMDIDITPLLNTPVSVDLELYKKTLIERFANHSVSDQVARLCFDGISKFPTYIVPNLVKMLQGDGSLIRMAFLLAAYRHYLKYQCDDKGNEFDYAEPWITPSDIEKIGSDDVATFLKITPFDGVDFDSNISFMGLYANACNQIKEWGVEATLKSIL
ncbi:MAG: mannitol dehydrogenase family protein [Rikenellaceae bacterium]